MHLVGDGFVWATNILARIASGSNEVFLSSRWGIWDTPIVTADPEEVPRLMEEEKPRLVLLDLMLPGSDGMELIRDILETADMSVVFLSVYGQDEVITRTFDKGAVDYITKPFSPPELAARIRAALRRRLPPELVEPTEPYVPTSWNPSGSNLTRRSLLPATRRPSRRPPIPASTPDAARTDLIGRRLARCCSPRCALARLLPRPTGCWSSPYTTS